MDKIDNTQFAQAKGVTRSPQMNAVIEEAEKVLDGIGSIDALREKVTFLEQLITQMQQVYNYEIKFQEKTEEFLKESYIIESSFQDLQKNVERIKKYFTKPKEAYLEEGVQGCIDDFHQLFESFDRLKEQEKKRKIYSRSPFLNEVMRVADCVLRGTLPPETLKERLDNLIRIQDQFYQNFDNMSPTEAERLIFEENRDKIKKSMKDMLEGLHEAKLYFKDFDPEHVERGMEKANEAADYLVDMEEKLKRAKEAPRVKYCFKCGAENPLSVKYCVNCNFNFPPLQMKEESTIDVKLEEGGIRQTGHVMTENIVKLATAVENIKLNKISIEDYQETLDWFGDLLERTKEGAKKIKEPQNVEDPESLEAFENFKETFYQGIEDMEEGLQRLRIYVQSKNPNLLETGMERVMMGGDRLYHVHMTAEQLKALAQEQQPKNPNL